jgi:NAD(P)-dependent dehydrogenase (short-subunit alcohol dehydrogenase family)
VISWDAWTLPGRVEEFIARFTYLRRPQTAGEIADAAVYLCRADNVTGITLTVAGGGEVH